MSGSLERLTTTLADGYRIERELGAGGMATVYLAEERMAKARRHFTSDFAPLGGQLLSR